MADAVKRGRIVLVRKVLAFKVVFLRGEDMEPVIQNPRRSGFYGHDFCPKMSAGSRECRARPVGLLISYSETDRQGTVQGDWEDDT